MVTRGKRRSVGMLACLIVTIGAALVMFGRVASAEPVEVIVDSEPVTLESGDGGVHTAKVFVINASDDKLFLDVSDDGACKVGVKPGTIASARRTEVEFTFRPACDVKKGAAFDLEVTGAITETIPITADPAPEKPAPDWDILGLAAAIAAAATIVSLGFFFFEIDVLKRRNNTPDAAKARRRAKLIEQLKANRERATFGVVEIPPVNREVPPPKIAWGTELSNLGTSWSFQEAWVANVTIGTSAIVGIVASTSILEAAFGAASKPALALAAVVAAITAVSVLLAPLFLKAIGSKIGTPTVGGLFVASTVVLWGTYFQLAALTIQADRLVKEDAVKLAIALAGITIGIIVIAYSARAIADIIRIGITPKPSAMTEGERAAWIVYRSNVPAGAVLPILSDYEANAMVEAFETTNPTPVPPLPEGVEEPEPERLDFYPVPEFSLYGEGTSPGDESTRKSAMF